MKRLNCCGSVVTVLLLGLTARSATTYYVSPDGDDVNNDGTSWSAPFATIQRGLDACVNEDTVVVSNGTYVISEQLNTERQQLVLRSLTLDPKDVVIDCGQRCRGISAKGWKSAILGLTVENGWSAQSGGGIYLGSDGTVSNCIVRSCTSCVTDDSAQGGGIYAKSGTTICDSLIEDCTVSNRLETLTAKSTAKYSRGGGVYLTGRMIGCTVRRCSAYGPFNGYYGICSGGGIYAKASENSEKTALYAAEILNCTVCSNKAVSITASAQGDGGGISLECVAGYAEGQCVSNCHVFANQATFAGGGIYVSNQGRIVDSTIMGNAVDNTLSLAETPYADWGGGGGIRTRKPGVIIERCDISGNRVSIVTSGNKFRQVGGGGVLMSSAQSVIRDCMMTNNLAGFGAAIRLGDLDGNALAGFVVSNCYLAANSGDKGGIISSYRTDDNLIVSCLIASNLVSHGSVFNWYRAAGDATAGTVIRNSFYRGNENTSTDTSATTGAGFGLGEMGVAAYAPLRIEQCTFVNESLAYASGSLLGQRSSFSEHNATNLTFVGCLLYGDADHARCMFGGRTIQDGAHISYCYASNAPTTDPALGNFDSTTPPGFADEQAGDFRLAKNSPLVDQGGAAQAWMGAGRKNGPTDLGDGTVTLTKSADYGVNVAFNNARPRLTNGIPDIGCFEFYVPSGLLLLFR